MQIPVISGITPAQAPDLNAAIKELMPIVRAEARRMSRTLPPSVTLEALQAAGMEGAWQAARDFDGSGTLQGFAGQRIKQRMIDWVRVEHPAGRRGNKIAGTCGDDELALIASDDDPTARLEQSQEFEALMQSMKPGNRAVVERVLAGQKKQDIAAGLGVSAVRVSQLVNEAVGSKRKDRTPDNFDPAAVRLFMGQPVPPAQRKRVNRFRQMLDRMPATGHYELDPVIAQNLIAEMKKAKVRYCIRTLDSGLIGVWREPSSEQLKGSKQ
jgi:RNA polymerase sigma factor (sigma-70 family)